MRSFVSPSKGSTDALSVKWVEPTSRKASMNKLSSPFDTEAKLCNYSRIWHAHAFPIGLHSFHRKELGISSDAVTKWSLNGSVLVVWMGSMLRTKGWDGGTRTLQGADPAAPSSRAVQLTSLPPPALQWENPGLTNLFQCFTQKP